MLILPVIDLKNGIVVHGRAGQRETYQPVNSTLCDDARPDRVAAAFAAEFGFRQAYVADLDAIAGAPPDWGAYTQIAQYLPQLWIDAGVTDAVRADEIACWGDKVASPICGLESLPAVSVLRESLDRVGSERLVLSLDLFHGKTRAGVAEWCNACPKRIAEEVIRLGVRRMIVLDLARVGVNQGTGTREVARHVHQSYPEIEIVCGGGISTIGQLRQLQQDGCMGALVASALHKGRLHRRQFDAIISKPTVGTSDPC